MTKITEKYNEKRQFYKLPRKSPVWQPNTTHCENPECGNYKFGPFFLPASGRHHCVTCGRQICEWTPEGMSEAASLEELVNMPPGKGGCGSPNSDSQHVFSRWQCRPGLITASGNGEIRSVSENHFPGSWFPQNSPKYKFCKNLMES